MHIARVQSIFKAKISRLAKNIFQNLDVVTHIRVKASFHWMWSRKSKQPQNTVLLGFPTLQTVHAKCVTLRTTQNNTGFTSPVIFAKKNQKKTPSVYLFLYPDSNVQQSNPQSSLINTLQNFTNIHNLWPSEAKLSLMLIYGCELLNLSGCMCFWLIVFIVKMYYVHRRKKPLLI